MTMPEWRPVPGYEGLYEVSDQGEVRRLPSTLVVASRWGHEITVRRRGKTLSVYTDKDGYKSVVLCKRGAARSVRLARLVLAAFVGEGAGLEAGHKNHITTDNRLANLEWVTRKENEDQKTEAGRRPRFTRRTLSDEQIASMRSERAQGMSLKALAEKYNIALTYVCTICRGAVWKT